jgi:Flp pilus assembly protein protease CpaA
MNKLFLFFSFMIINGFFPIFLFYDLKYRRVPRVFFKICCIITVILNLLEYYSFSIHPLSFIFSKMLYGISAFILSLILFSLTIIGGSDGKVIILIFFVHPILFLNFTVLFSYFFIFSLLFIILIVINFTLNNRPRKNISFLLIFNTYSIISFARKSYIKGFFKFKNFSELDFHMEEKSLVKSLYLVYNAEINKFQLLCQSRLPLILPIIISYYIIFYFILLF